MKKIILLLMLAICPVFMYAQKGFKHASEGFAFCQNANYPKAIECFEKALKAKFYEDGVMYCRIAACYTEMNEKDKAIRCLYEGYNRFPNSIQIILALVEHTLEVNQKEECLKLIDKGLNVEALHSLYYVKGNILYETGKYDEALECYRKSEELAPDFGWGYYSIGLHYYEKIRAIQANYEGFETPESEIEKVKEIALTAVEYFEKAFSTTTDPQAKLGAADCLYNLGSAFQETDEYYKELSEKYSNYMENGIQL